MKHPVANSGDETSLLGKWDESVRADGAALWMKPTYQCLGFDQGAVHQVHDRLVIDLELIVFESDAYTAFGFVGMGTIAESAPCGSLGDFREIERDLFGRAVVGVAGDGVAADADLLEDDDRAGAS